MDVKRFFLISAFLIFPFLPGVAARADEPICGSVESFQRSHRWQDLPGCTEKRDYDDPVSAVTLLGRAKDAFKAFFENWEKGDIDEAEHNYAGVYVYTSGADEDWNTNPELKAARPAYEEMKQKVKQYEQWSPLVRELAESYFKAVVMIEEARKGAQYAAETAQRDAQELKQVMDRAGRANVPESF